MTSRSEPRDVAASVRARLRNLARDREIDFNVVLNRYAVERFLYRVSVSSEVDDFTLKGATLFRIWAADELRPTNDVDFLAAGFPDSARMRTALDTICATPCREDGVVFDPTTIRMREIRQGQQFGGLRVRIGGILGQARLHLQVDIGFGDVVTPERELQDYPTLLDAPAPRLWTYPRETLIAEKLEAMVRLGESNTRMKDLWDVACLARGFAFDGETLRAAIDETFRRRRTILTGERPLALLPDYYEDTARVERWRAMRERIGPHADGPAGLSDAGNELRSFLGPVCDSLVDDRPFTQAWRPGGSWQGAIHEAPRGETL